MHSSCFFLSYPYHSLPCVVGLFKRKIIISREKKIINFFSIFQRPVCHTQFPVLLSPQLWNQVMWVPVQSFPPLYTSSVKITWPLHSYKGQHNQTTDFAACCEGQHASFRVRQTYVEFWFHFFSAGWTWQNSIFHRIYNTIAKTYNYFTYYQERKVSAN